MGSYCEIYLNSYQIDTNKSYIDPFYSVLFNEGDRRSRKVSWDTYYTKPLDGDLLVPTYEYAATARVLKPRLELLGFSLDEVLCLYPQSMKAQLEYYQESMREYDQGREGRHIKYFGELYEKGFDYWLQAIRQIIDQGTYQRDLRHDRDRDKDDLVTFLLDLGMEDFGLGYTDLSYGHFLRAILEAVDDKHELVLDITSLVHAGYYEVDEPVCEVTVQSQVSSTIIFQKIIILTEGRTDSEFLGRALHLLHPELEHYFSFLEFDQLKAEGGSAALERNVRAFAAAGISNKVVALFDNDAAGSSSIDRLSKFLLPRNIKVLALPDLVFAENYPTKGPQGTTLENVNGRACSIEMYFGTDILDINGTLTSVLWKSMEERIKTYQGELERKSELQQRFREKLTEAERNGISPDQDWSGMDVILRTIFKASAESPRTSCRLTDCRKK